MENQTMYEIELSYWNEVKKILISVDTTFKDFKSVIKKEIGSTDDAFIIILQDDCNDESILIEDNEDMELICQNAHLVIKHPNDYYEKNSTFIVSVSPYIQWIHFHNYNSKQTITDDTPSSFVMGRNKPFPRVVDIPESTMKITIHVKGRENENGLLNENVIEINNPNCSHVDFINFSINRTTFNEATHQYESMTLVFHFLDKNGKFTWKPIETDSFIVVSPIEQMTTLDLNELIPNRGVALQSHRVVLMGKFGLDSNKLQVFVGNEMDGYTSVDFEYLHEHVLIIILRSDVIKNIDIFVQTTASNMLIKSVVLKFEFY